MNTALLIIDVQNDYFPGGRWELNRSCAALVQIKKLLGYFRESGRPVIFIRHISAPGAPFFEPGTDGTEIRTEIAPQETETVLVKHHPNSFHETALREKLSELGAYRLVVCGMMTHMCVDTTVRAADDLGYKVILISDACADHGLEWQGETIPADTAEKVFMASIDGQFAEIMTCGEYLAR